jgi:succinate dehydrogenase hydrophobic anchor subunit
MNAIKDGAPSNDRREGIRSWADRHISGTVLAAHFMNILHAALQGAGKQTTAPWVAGMADPFSRNTSAVH